MKRKNPPKSETTAAEVKRHLTTQVQHRAHAAILRESTNEEARTVDIAWASEQPVERWFGMEVLDCAPASVRMGRLNDGAAVLFNHDPNRLIGVVEQVQIGADRVCRARVRFDTCDEAEMRFKQVRNGVLRHVSVGYRVHAYELEKEKEGVRTYRMTSGVRRRRSRPSRLSSPRPGPRPWSASPTARNALGSALARSGVATAAWARPRASAARAATPRPRSPARRAAQRPT